MCHSRVESWKFSLIEYQGLFYVSALMFRTTAGLRWSKLLGYCMPRVKTCYSYAASSLLVCFPLRPPASHPTKYSNMD